MTNPILVALEEQVQRTRDVEQSATVMINGFGDRLTAAVAQALENGATAEEIAPIQAEIDAMRASSDALSAAIVANTPSGRPTP